MRTTRPSVTVMIAGGFVCVSVLYVAFAMRSDELQLAQFLAEGVER